MIKFLPADSITPGVAIVLGTRPGIIKMSPVVAALKQLEVPVHLIHTGQHYSPNMDRTFLRDLDMPKPYRRVFGVSRHPTHAAQTAVMMIGIEEALIELKPSVVLVGGDANTNLAGALAARKLRLTLAHLEAGLRSFDWRMPEEHNRVMIDHISDILFAPTPIAEHHLRREAVRGTIFVTGNTIVDACRRNLPLARKKGTLRRQLGLAKRSFLLFTSHREENVDEPPRLAAVVEVLRALCEVSGLRGVFPTHPRTLSRLQQTGLLRQLEGLEAVTMTGPLGYFDLLDLIDAAECVITDSGGIQEEACILGTPCLTIRDSTERPETVEVGCNIVVGLDRSQAVDSYREIVQRRSNWIQPFGDGHAAERIADVLKTLATRPVVAVIGSRQPTPL